MRLEKRLEETGDLLFRLRGVIPLLAVLEFPLAAARGSLGGSARGDVLPFVALGLGSLGLLLRGLVIGSAAPGTSGRNTCRQKAATLNVTGAYSIVRNPLYLGNFLCWSAASLLLRDPLLFALNVGLFVVFYLLIVLREEAFLSERFGDAYREYADRVPAFWPRPELWRAPERGFSVRRVLRREQDGFLMFIATLFAIEGMRHWWIQGTGPLADFWYLLLFAAGVLWLMLRSAKELTPLLDDPRLRDASP